jgi:hypothetical protein
MALAPSGPTTLALPDQKAWLAAARLRLRPHAPAAQRAASRPLWPRESIFVEAFASPQQGWLIDETAVFTYSPLFMYSLLRGANHRPFRRPFILPRHPIITRLPSYHAQIAVNLQYLAFRLFSLFYPDAPGMRAGLLD